MAQTPPSSSALRTQPQTLLVLVGLIGSGKSTFANELEQTFGWVRANQDELQGNRRLVEQKVRQALASGKSVVVDRTNFDAQQRAHFLRIAASFPQPKFSIRIHALFLDLPLPIIRARLATRTDHPTITSPEHAYEVLDRFSRDLRPPEVGEGFDRVLRWTGEVGRGMGEVVEILEKVESEGERRTLWIDGGWHWREAGGMDQGGGAGSRWGGDRSGWRGGGGRGGYGSYRGGGDGRGGGILGSRPSDGAWR